MSSLEFSMSQNLMPRETERKDHGREALQPGSGGAGSPLGGHKQPLCKKAVISLSFTSAVLGLAGFCDKLIKLMDCLT